MLTRGRVDSGSGHKAYEIDDMYSENLQLLSKGQKAKKEESKKEKPKKEEDVGEALSRKELYELYKKETNGRPLYKGQETKKFKEWLKKRSSESVVSSTPSNLKIKVNDFLRKCANAI